MSEDPPRSSRGLDPALVSLGQRTKARLTGEPLPVIDDLACGVIAPVLVTFVCWVLAHARAVGTRRLYFVARDGEILFRIARSLQPRFPDLDLRYLHGSRRAWLAPSIHPARLGWERLVIAAGQANSPSDMVERAGLACDDQSRIRDTLQMSEQEWRRPLSPAKATLFIRRVVGTPAAFSAIYDKVASHRASTLAYFRQEGLFDDVEWALVDTGWALNSQAALKRILEIEGGSTPTGYYLGLSGDHLPEEETGPANALVAASGAIFSRRRVVIEHCFTPSTHTTTKEYRIRDQVSIPVFGPELRTTGELAYADRLHEAASAMATIASSDAHALGYLVNAREELLARAERLICKPTRGEANALASLGTIADLRHERAYVQPLCRPLGGRDVWDVARVAIFGTSVSAKLPMWLEGSCALSQLPARAILRSMLAVDRVLHPSATQ